MVAARALLALLGAVFGTVLADGGGPRVLVARAEVRETGLRDGVEVETVAAGRTPERIFSLANAIFRRMPVGAGAGEPAFFRLGRGEDVGRAAGNAEMFAGTGTERADRGLPVAAGTNWERIDVGRIQFSSHYGGKRLQFSSHYCIETVRLRQKRPQPCGNEDVSVIVIDDLNVVPAITIALVQLQLLLRARAERC